MIRVVHVLGGLDRGGAETLVMNLYRAIDKTKIQFDFITHTAGHQAYYDEIISMGGKIYFFPPFNGINYLEVVKQWNKFFDEHPEYQILHSHVRSYACIYLKIARKYGVKTIIHSHNTSNGKGVKAMAKKIFQIPLRKSADYYFGCSKEAGEWLFGKKIVKGKKYYMLKNGVSLDNFRIEKKWRDEIRNELNLDEECVVVGTVGRLTEQKNPDFILNICANLNKSRIKDNFCFLWVGVGEKEQYIKNKIMGLGLDSKVKMLGSRSDINKLMQAMDIFILPSFFEGLPVASVEAQASGLQTLVSDTVTRDVDISKNIHYIPIGDSRIWCDKILTANLEKKNVMKEIQECGFDINSSAKWLSTFYMDMYMGRK